VLRVSKIEGAGKREGREKSNYAWQNDQMEKNFMKSNGRKEERLRPMKVRLYLIIVEKKSGERTQDSKH